MKHIYVIILFTVLVASCMPIPNPPATPIHTSLPTVVKVFPTDAFTPTVAQLKARENTYNSSTDANSYQIARGIDTGVSTKS